MQKGHNSKTIGQHNKGKCKIDTTKTHKQQETNPQRKHPSKYKAFLKLETPQSKLNPMKQQNYKNPIEKPQKGSKEKDIKKQK